MSKAKDLTTVSPDYRAWQRGETMPRGMRNCVDAMISLLEEAATERPPDEYIGDLFEWRADWARRASESMHSWRTLTDPERKD